MEKNNVILGPIADCRSCQMLFMSRAFAASNCRNMSYFGCIESCPRCGGPAFVLDGTYDFVEDTVRLVSGPGFTIEKVKLFQQLTQQAARNEIPESKYEEAIAAIS